MNETWEQNIKKTMKKQNQHMKLYFLVDALVCVHIRSNFILLNKKVVTKLAIYI